MMTGDESGTPCSPMRALEMLTARFGAFETVANLVIELNRKGSDECLPMDWVTAEAILEFADDLRQARHATSVWAKSRCIGMDV